MFSGFQSKSFALLSLFQNILFFFEAILNGIIFLIPFSVPCLLLTTANLGSGLHFLVNKEASEEEISIYPEILMSDPNTKLQI